VRRSSLAAGLCLLALLPAVPAHAGRHSIQSTVLTRNGEPVGRARITLSPGNVELVTDREGRFLIDYLRDEQGERIKLDKKTDYALEVFKVGYHPQTTSFYFKRGELVLPEIVLVEKTIQVDDVPVNIDPDTEVPTHAAGAAYEGQ
jgi:hypothetical protein